MPHSVSPEGSPNAISDDGVLPDTPPENSDTATARQREESDNAVPESTTDKTAGCVKVDDMFDGDDDDEFSSSAPDNRQEESLPASESE